MIRLAALLAALCAPVVAYADRYPAQVTDIYDGDTLTADLNLGLGVVLVGQKIRLQCVDTPELRGAERALGLAVRDRVRGWLDGATVEVEIVGQGKYGRWLGFVFADGDSVNARLIAEGLAVVPSYAEGCE